MKKNKEKEKQEATTPLPTMCIPRTPETANPTTPTPIPVSIYD